MEKYELVRTGHRAYDKNITELSEITGHSRNTIRKVLRGEPAGYKEREHQPFPVLAPYTAIIDEWLTKDKEQPKKQRHTARRVYNRLVLEHGFTGGESNVRRYVRFARLRLGLNTSGAFIPCDPEAGHEAEVDWGLATAIIAGETVQLKFFCMRSKFSGKHFVRCYPCERQQAFLDAHLHAFVFFGGVFPVLIYDNLTTAVKKVLKGRNRLEQEGFSRFRAYHSFEPRFCNPGAGHEKGGVEGLVGFARRNYMVPVPEAGSIEELNARLLVACGAYGSHRMDGRERSVNELHEEEMAHLMALPEAGFSNVETHDCRVDKYATVIVDKNRYSVASRYVGFTAKVVLHVDRVEIFASGKNIATHNRLYGSNKWSLDPDHYLDLLKERPMAFNSARPIRQWRDKWQPDLQRLLERFCERQGETNGIKDFIAVLMLYRDYTGGDVDASVSLAMEIGISDSAGVQHILVSTGEQAAKIAPLETWDKLPPPDVAAYGKLGGVR